MEVKEQREVDAVCHLRRHQDHGVRAAEKVPARSPPKPKGCDGLNLWKALSYVAMQPKPAHALLAGIFAMLLSLFPLQARGYETLHPFVGLTGDVFMGPFGYSDDYNWVVTGGGGIELGLDSDFGWQLRLHVLGLAQSLPYLAHYWSGTIDLRWNVPTFEKQWQPYFSIGGGYAHGTDIIGTFNTAVFELGTGIRYIFGVPYLGLDAEWVNLNSATFEAALGARF
jgi:hypothetical protein